MVSFGLHTPAEEAKRINRFWAEQDRAGQQRWQDREARTRYAEAQQTQALAAAQQHRLGAENAGLFNSMDQQLADIRPSGAPEVRPTQAPAAGLTPEQIAGNTQFARAMTRRAPRPEAPEVDVGLDLDASPDLLNSIIREGEEVWFERFAFNRNPQLRSQLDALAQQGLIEINPGAGGSVRVRPTRRAITQSRAHPNATIDATTNPMDSVVALNAPTAGLAAPAATAAPTNMAGRAPEVAEFLRSRGYTITSVERTGNAAAGGHPEGNSIDIRGGPGDVDRIVNDIRQQYPGLPVEGMFEPAGQRNRGGSVSTGNHVHVDLGPVAGGGRTQSAGLQAPASAAARVEDDPYYQQVADTSRMMVPTEPMRLLHANIQRAYQRSQLLAQRGDVAGSDAAWASALQQQAAYYGMGQQALYQAATTGNLRAAALLTEQANGYPSGTVRFAPTSERNPRFVLEVMGNDGSWVREPGEPMTRDGMLGSLLNLVDAQGAASRREAQWEMYQAMLGYQQAVDVANINFQASRLDNITDAAIAGASNETRRAIAEGTARAFTNTEDGTTYVAYPNLSDPEGPPVIIEQILTEEQPSPDTEGRDTINVPVRRLATGVTGTRGVRAR